MPDPPKDETLVALRGEILDALAPVMFEVFAAHAWGRILVATTRRSDALVVASIDVDDVLGPDGDIESAMGSPEVLGSLEGLARAIDTLVSTHDLDVDVVGGGTLLRRGPPEAGFGFLPGLVRAPSAGFERRRDALGAAETRSGENALRGAIPFGTFAKESVTFTHAWANPSTPSEGVKAARRVCDEFPDRSLWEIATPQFATDLETGWALTRVVAQAVGGTPVRHDTDEGTIFGIARP